MNYGIFGLNATFAITPRALLGRPTPFLMPGGRDVVDPDAAAYLAAVEAADQATLEPGVRIAIDNFVLGCKADGIWSALRASCILMGARTLRGALTPLVGAAPTNNNFVSGDYNRRTGLIGNASTKWLNSNRNNNADGQNDFHMACYASSASTTLSRVYMGAGAATNEFGASNFGIDTATTSFFRCRTASTSSGGTARLLMAVTRQSSGIYGIRTNNAENAFFINSQTPANANIGIFSATNGAFAVNARLAFYSIGSYLVTSTLDARVSALVNAIGAEIA